MSSKERPLVLVIDRDNDIGSKVGVSGPVVERDEVLETAKKLALADPEDSDANTLFAGVRLYDQLKKKNKNVGIAVVSGDQRVGVKSDQVISKQLEEVLKTHYDEAIVVSDGAEDEYVIPVVQSHIKIASIKKVVVKQSENLEGVYYLFVKFFKDMLNEPSTARIFLGIPAIVLLIFALLGTTGWRLVLGVLGVYLMIRGFQLEKYIFAVQEEMVKALKRGTVSFFLYFVGGAFLIIGAAQGYWKMEEYAAFDLFTSGLALVNGAINTFFFAGILFWLGKLLITYSSGKPLSRHFTILALMFSINIVVLNATGLLLTPEKGIYDLILAIFIGFLVLTGTMIIEKINR